MILLVVQTPIFNLSSVPITKQFLHVTQCCELINFTIYMDIWCINSGLCVGRFLTKLFERQMFTYFFCFTFGQQIPHHCARYKNFSCNLHHLVVTSKQYFASMYFCDYSLVGSAVTLSNNVVTKSFSTKVLVALPNVCSSFSQTYKKKSQFTR